MRSAGDARTALGALESAGRSVLAARAGGRGRCHGYEHPADHAAGCRGGAPAACVRYDKDRDQHYDTISAFIKSTRASDPDAALYYLAVMLRRAERIRATWRAPAGARQRGCGQRRSGRTAGCGRRRTGRRSCGHARVQLRPGAGDDSPGARAQKSKAGYHAINAARDHVRRFGAATPPAALRGANYPGAKALGGRGAGYDDPHTHPDGISPAPVMPDGLESLRFYDPVSRRRASVIASRRLRCGAGDDGCGALPARSGAPAVSWRRHLPALLWRAALLLAATPAQAASPLRIRAWTPAPSEANDTVRAPRRRAVAAAARERGWRVPPRATAPCWWCA